MSDGFIWGAAAEQLRAAMRKNGVSTAKLAELSGLSQTTVRGTLNGTASPTVGTLVRLADALGLSIEFGFSRPRQRPAPKPARRARK